MIYRVPFEARHFAQMQVQDEQAGLLRAALVADLKALEGPYASTLMQDGLPLACAGAVPYWKGRAYVWSFLSVAVDWRTFPLVHTAAKDFLAGLPFRRLEASVVIGFENGHRWLKALGFEVEAPLQRKFLEDGQDTVGYVLIRNL